MKNRKIKCLCLSAILSALGVALLYLGALFEVLDLTLAALASFIVAMSVIELGGIWPYMIWACTSALSLFLLPSKFIALIYLVFAGIYPILKAKFERYHPALSWPLKISAFNAMLILAYLGAEFVFGIENSPLALDIIFFALANLAFVLYDIAMSKIIVIYIVKIRKRLKINKFMED